MSVIAQYQRFKAQLQGWTDVPLATFRLRLLPLVKQRGAPAAADVELLEALAVSGAGPALKDLLRGNAEALRVVGEAPGVAEPPPLTFDELAAVVGKTFRDCARRGWTVDQYRQLQASLDEPPRTESPRGGEGVALAGNAFGLARGVRLHVADVVVGWLISGGAAATADEEDDARFYELYRTNAIVRRAVTAMFQRVIDKAPRDARGEHLG
jgi:hypothetical protein